MKKEKLDSSIPRNAKEPKGAKQSSGKTQHGRMTTAPKVETLSGMPSTH